MDYISQKPRGQCCLDPEGPLHCVLKGSAAWVLYSQAGKKSELGEADGTLTSRTGVGAATQSEALQGQDLACRARREPQACACVGSGEGGLCDKMWQTVYVCVCARRGACQDRVGWVWVRVRM